MSRRCLEKCRKCVEKVSGGLMSGWHFKMSTRHFEMSGWFFKMSGWHFKMSGWHFKMPGWHFLLIFKNCAKNIFPHRLKVGLLFFSRDSRPPLLLLPPETFKQHQKTLQTKLQTNFKQKRNKKFFRFKQLQTTTTSKNNFKKTSTKHLQKNKQKTLQKETLQTNPFSPEKHHRRNSPDSYFRMNLPDK